MLGVPNLLPSLACLTIGANGDGGDDGGKKARKLPASFSKPPKKGERGMGQLTADRHPFIRELRAKVSAFVALVDVVDSTAEDGARKVVQSLENLYYSLAGQFQSYEEFLFCVTNKKTSTACMRDHPQLAEVAREILYDWRFSDARRTADKLMDQHRSVEEATKLRELWTNLDHCIPHSKIRPSAEISDDDRTATALEKVREASNEYKEETNRKRKEAAQAAQAAQSEPGPSGG